jgi:hypothetical protein
MIKKSRHKNHRLQIVLVVLCTIISNYSKAQLELSIRLQQQIGGYKKTIPQEKIFAHLDKEFYLAGEILWFKLYLAEGTHHQLLDLSKIVYVEILSNEKKPVLQAKIPIEEGTGSGSFVLPSYISTGNYLFRAYTSWMKNFSVDMFFEKQITIVNSLKSGSNTLENTEAAQHYAEFFPEGGNLVYDLESKLAFQVTDRYGNGVVAQGLLVNSNNDTIQRFSTSKFGKGNIRFTPVRGNRYRAIFQIQDATQLSQAIPDAFEKGFVMQVSAEGDMIKVKVNSKNEENNYYTVLVIHNGNSVRQALTQPLRNGRSEFLIDKKQLPVGVSHFTVFTDDHRAVCERLYFKRPGQTMSLSLKADQSIYGGRSLVNMELTSATKDGKALTGDFSLSVFRIDSLDKGEQLDIFTYLWLQSELRGRIESPEFYFENSPESDEALENLLLTQGWRRFKWEEILSDTKAAFQFLPEFAGHLINGRIVDRRTQTPAAGINAFLSIPGEKFQFAAANSEKDGRLRFDIKNFYSAGEIVIQTDHKKDSIYQLSIMNPFSDKYSSTQVAPLVFSDRWKNALTERITGSQLQNAFAVDTAQQFILPGFVDTSAFYGKGDKTYFLDDYTRFASMEEVMREYVAEVLVRRPGGKFHYKVSNAPYKVFFDEDPLVLLDGVPVFDIDRIMAFDPLKIKKADIITRRYYAGGIAYNGIVSYSTYQGDLAGFQLDPNALLLEYPGLQLNRQFYSPSYETAAAKQSRIPDFRTLLFWSPDIKTGDSGKSKISFYTSDLAGSYIAILQGISADGLAGSTVLRFTVAK